MELKFRPMTRTDFPVFQKWLSKPHVDAWWHQPFNLVEIEEKYGPRVDGIQPTYMYVVLYRENPIGWIQWYRWADYPDHAAQLSAAKSAAGIDLGIGETDFLGKGLGPKVIHQFIQEIVFVHPEITGIVSDPEEENVRSLRAFEKAGFDIKKVIQLKGESVKRRVVVLNRS